MVRLSPKHGVNPTITLCNICLESTGIALVGSKSKKMFGTDEAPHQSLLPGVYCSKCEEQSKTHVAMIPCGKPTGAKVDPKDVMQNLANRPTDDILWIKRDTFAEMFDCPPIPPKMKFVFASPELIKDINAKLQAIKDSPEIN